MLAYLLNGNQFLLDIKTSVRLTWRNPACNFDEFPGDVGLGIDIPVNDQNRMLLGNPERFDRYLEDNDLEFPGFEVRYSGVLLMSGTLVVQNADNEVYSGWLRSNVGDLGKAHKEKYIYEIDEFDEEVSWVNKSNYVPGTDDYACPRILNPEFFRDKGREMTISRMVSNPDYIPDIDDEEDRFIEDELTSTTFTEAFLNSAGWFVNALNGDDTVIAVDSFGELSTLGYNDSNVKVNVVSPMLFLDRVIEALIKDAGMSLNDDFIGSDYDFKKLIIYNNYDITDIVFHSNTTQWASFPWLEDEDLGGSFLPYKAIAQYIDSISRTYDGTFKYNSLLPKVRLKSFVLGIQNLINVFFHFRHDDKVDIIDRETILDGDTIDISQYLSDKWIIGERKDVTLKFMFTHDGDDVYFQERWEDVDDVRDNEKAAVNSLSDLQDIENPELEEIRYITSINCYYQFRLIQKEEYDPDIGDTKQTDMLGWQHFSYGFQHGLINPDKDEEEDITTVFSTLFGDQTVAAEQPGNTKMEKYAYSNFSPRLLFYNGNNRAKFETNNAGVLMDNYSLDWEKEETGLLETRWKRWGEYWARRLPVETDGALPLNAIDYVIRNIWKKFKSDDGEFIIEELECEFGLHDIGISKIKGYKV